MKRSVIHIKQKHDRVCKHSENLFTRSIDKIVLFSAFLMPLIELPQLLEIYTKKSAENVSLFTWGFFVIFGIPWLIYGIIHKQKPVIVLYALWVLVDSTIVLGILLYR